MITMHELIELEQVSIKQMQQAHENHKKQMEIISLARWALRYQMAEKYPLPLVKE